VKLLGIDYGLKRIGLATAVAGVASPFLTIENRGEKKNLSRLLEIIKSERIEKIVVGDGFREFGELLGEVSGLEVVFVDERLSSWEAEEHIRNNLGIIKREKVKELIDKMAAVMILNNYIGGAV